jgi:L-cysteine S-thiosulfotransferase
MTGALVAGRRALVFIAAAALSCVLAAAGEIPQGERRSGFEFMSRETQGMQRDDMLNPGMLWVLEGAALWTRKAGTAGRSCADCHGEAAASMRGVAARYPAYDTKESRAIDLQGRVNACRVRHQDAAPFAAETQELLGLVTYIANQSRGMAIAPDHDERLAPFREHGRQLFNDRFGQLHFSCAQCHDGLWGERLGSSVIPQAHPTGYPIYRLEWQAVGSLQRRLRNCMTGIRAEPPAYGAQDYVDLELFLMYRARGLPIETPAVRP